MKIITIKVDANHDPTALVNAIENLVITQFYDYTIRVETPKKEGEK